MSRVEQLPYDGILVAYDGDSRSYYCIWQPLTSVGLGKAKAEVLAAPRRQHFLVMRAALYARVSSEEQAEGYSIDAQKRATSSFAVRVNIQYLEVTDYV